MSEIDTSEQAPIDPNVNENTISPVRPDRSRQLSLKATESFDLSRQVYVDTIEKVCTKIDKFLDILPNEDDPEVAKKVFDKAKYQFRVYTTNCTKLLNLCLSADTSEAHLLHKNYSVYVNIILVIDMKKKY